MWRNSHRRWRLRQLGLRQISKRRAGTLWLKPVPHSDHQRNPDPATPGRRREVLSQPNRRQAGRTSRIACAGDPRQPGGLRRA
jgi:hypothetical protein